MELETIILLGLSKGDVIEVESNTPRRENPELYVRNLCYFHSLQRRDDPKNASLHVCPFAPGPKSGSTKSYHPSNIRRIIVYEAKNDDHSVV